MYCVLIKYSRINKEYGIIVSITRGCIINDGRRNRKKHG